MIFETEYRTDGSDELVQTFFGQLFQNFISELVAPMISKNCEKNISMGRMILIVAKCLNC